MATSTITRLAAGDLTEVRFVEEHLASGRPLVVDGALEDWDLPSLGWDALVDRFGERPVQLYDDLFSLIDIQPLARYAERAARRHSERAPVPYARWYTELRPMPRMPWADAVFEAIAHQWCMPAFLPTEGYLLPAPAGPGPISPTTSAFPARALFISAAGARTRRHVDPWASDAVLCQVEGIKRVVLHDPEGASGPDRFDLHAGQLVFLPAGWEHEVDTIEPSVSITWNFVHAATWPRFFAYLLDGPPTDERLVLDHFAGPARQATGTATSELTIAEPATTAKERP